MKIRNLIHLKLLIITIFILLASACSNKDSENRKLYSRAEELFQQGEFNQAWVILSKLEPLSAGDPVFTGKIEILKAKMNRIRIDFSKTEEKIREELKPWFPDPDPTVLEGWEKSKKLEMRYIDGKKWYFRQAVNNLFRIDSVAMKIRNRSADPLDLICLNHTGGILANMDSLVITGSKPFRFRIDYSISLDSGAVPDGEVVRCWMPYPRNVFPRQRNIKLLNINSIQFSIAPDTVMQRSLYMEKTVKKGEPVVFSYTAEFETVPQYFRIQKMHLKPYDVNSKIYKEFTAERPPQIVFTHEIRQLSASLTKGITDPYYKVRSIFTWIDRHLPWASALEYSIMENIPHYVLENGHGDCGMKTLLFMSLARAAGIPCKWQSGWMLHPGEINLHDWCEVFYEGVGWVPVDQSFGLQESDNDETGYFYSSGIDAYRLIVNDDYGTAFYPTKKFYRSEPIDFQRGELEWKGGNLYFDKWDYHMNVIYLPDEP